MSVHRISTRYAKSLIDLAEDQGKLDRVMEDVQVFHQAALNRDLQLMLKSPIITADKKDAIFDALFGGKFDVLTMAFLKILVKKGREALLKDIAQEAISEYKKIRHITTVHLTTAAPLSAAIVEAIRQKLDAMDTTDDNVEINTRVNPDLIGGFVIEFDDKLYDDSVAHHLQQAKKEFKDNLYISQIMT